MSKLLTVLVLGLMIFSPATAGDAKRVATGATQVVASVDGREITLSELRLEMARLGLDPMTENAEALALQSLVDRHLITTKARAADLHKRPEALWRMEAAREVALAETYMQTVTQVPEPTQSAVEQFILDHPSLFLEARSYSFQVIDIDTSFPDIADLTPLFDETSDFSLLRAHLDEANVSHRESRALRPAASFPDAVREQLASYGVNDNIVLEGPQNTSIMKITGIEDARLTMSESLPMARSLLRQRNLQTRTATILRSMRENGDVTIYRPSARPPEEASQ